MVRLIKVFIGAKWIVKHFSSDSSAWAWGGWAPEHEFEKFISRDDVLALKTAREVAEECGLKLKVYDLSSLTGWISAYVNKVKITPTVLINNNRIEGLPSKDELLKIIQ